MPEVADALSNTYFDTAASPFLYSDRIFELVSDLLGPERILNDPRRKRAEDSVA